MRTYLQVLVLLSDKLILMISEWLSRQDLDVGSGILIPENRSKEVSNHAQRQSASQTECDDGGCGRMEADTAVRNGGLTGRL